MSKLLYYLDQGNENAQPISETVVSMKFLPRSFNFRKPVPGSFGKTGSHKSKNINFLTFKQRLAEIEYMKTINALEIEKAKALAEIEVRKSHCWFNFCVNHLNFLWLLFLSVW